jgi:HK97 family phage major capsid protein
VVFNDRIPGLGSTGDLMLLDLSYYLIKDGSGPFVAMSEHVHFTQNKTVIKAFWNVDGQPWLDEPIPLEGSTANTVSPFVVLSS